MFGHTKWWALRAAIQARPYVSRMILLPSPLALYAKGGGFSLEGIELPVIVRLF